MLKIAKNIVGAGVFVLLLTNSAHADFGVSVNKQVNVDKEQKISAKIEGEQKIIEGILKVTPSGIGNGAGNETGNKVIDITWTVILDKKSRISVSGLSSTLELDKPFITRGTALLVRGNTPSQLNFKTPEERKEDKKREIPSNSKTGGTNINTGGISSPVTGESSVGNELIRPEYIRTYDGCMQVYDANEEIIHAYQQVYYVDNQGKKIVVEECTRIKDFPAERKSCDILHDFPAKTSYKRYQPYFSEDNKTYGAGGCVPLTQHLHQIDFEECPAKSMGDTYIKQGQWFFNEESGEKTYISGCVLDPEGRVESLLVRFEGCPVKHDVKANQSQHLGRYYWVRADNSVEFLSECTETNKSYFGHKIIWNGEAEGKHQWVHNNSDNYSQMVFTRYFDIETEDRRIVIDDKELDPVKYNHQMVQNGWRNYDNVESQGGSMNSLVNLGWTGGGYSNKWIQQFVFFGSDKFFTGKEYEGERINHVRVKQTNIRPGYCLGSSSSHTYQDEIRRADNSTYLTNNYFVSEYCVGSHN